VADVVFGIDVEGNADKKIDGIADSADKAAVKVEVLAARLKTLPDAKIDADIADLEHKLTIAKAKLEGTTGTYRAKLEADISQLETKLAIAKGEMSDFSQRSGSDLAGMVMSWQGAALGIAAVSSQIVGFGSVAGVSFLVAKMGATGLSDTIQLLGQRTGIAGKETDELNKKISDSMAQLSTGGKEFALEINSLMQGPVKQLEISAQNGLYKGLADGLKAATPQLRELNPLVADFSTKLGNLIGPMIPQLTKLTESIVKFATASLDGLTKAGLGKTIQDLADGLGKMFDHLTESGEADEAMRSFVKILEATATTLPPLLELLLNLSNLFMAVEGPTLIAAKALAAVLDVLNKLLSLPTKLLEWVMGGAGGGSGAASIIQSTMSSVGMADGGTVTGAGWSWVGEEGPELRYMPTGASVIPLSQVGNLGGGGDTHIYNISGVIGPAASVVTAIRSANVQTRRRGYGGGIS